MGKYLPIAINSVLRQTYSNIEIIVIDDGSTDNTQEVIRDFNSDPRFNYYYQNNCGQPKAKNAGILKANGAYIAFLDGDDIWLKNKLEKQIPCIQNNNQIGVVYTGLSYIDGNGEILNTPRIDGLSGDITKKLLIKNFVTGMTSLVRSECFEKVGIFDETIPMGIDYDLWLRISTQFHFLFLNETTYLYRIWSGQMSHNFEKRFDCAKIIMDRFIDTHGDLLDKATINEAWAHTYVGKGYGYVDLYGNKMSALREYLHALKFKPNYLPAWKAIIKLLIR